MKRQCQPEAGSRAELFEEIWFKQHFKNEEMVTGMGKYKGTFRQPVW
jgi:hypothetical protein